MTRQVLAEFITVFKEDVDLELNVAKTVILPGKGCTEESVFLLARIHLYVFCRKYQATRLQYINSHIMLNNRCVLQQ